MELGRRAGWDLPFTLVTLVCGTIPLLSFWAEHRATQRVRAEHSELVLYYSSNGPSYIRSNAALMGLVQALAHGVYSRDEAAHRDRIRAFKLK